MGKRKVHKVLKIFMHKMGICLKELTETFVCFLII